MNTCEKYIRDKSESQDIKLLRKGYFSYVIKNRKNEKIYISESLFEDRKRISKKFKKIISALEF